MTIGNDTKKLWKSPNGIYEIWQTQIVLNNYQKKMYGPNPPVAAIHYMDEYRGGYAEIHADGKITSGTHDSYTFQILPKYVKEKCISLLKQLYKKY